MSRRTSEVSEHEGGGGQNTGSVGNRNCSFSEENQQMNDQILMMFAAQGKVEISVVISTV